MPSKAPASGSVIRSPPPLAMIAETRSPLLAVSFSVIVVRVIVPLGSRTGASFSPVTVTSW